MSRRSLLLLNSVVRAAYGVGALIAPAAMARARFAPDTGDRPDARLFVRGFGAHQIAVAAVGLAALRSPRAERPALLLAVAIDAADVLSAVVEAGDRGAADADTMGGIAFSAAGFATAAAALRAQA